MPRPVARRAAALLLLCALAARARGADNSLAPAACVTPGAAAATDYFPSKLAFADAAQVSVAQYFTVTYHGYYKFVRDLRGDTPRAYVLYQCGATAPDAATLAAAHDAFLPNATQYFQVPVSSVACGSTSALNYLELLGLSSTLKVVDMRFVTSPCLMRLAECGALTHASAEQSDYEPSDAWLAATSAVSLVLTDSYGTGGTGSGRDVDVDASFDPGILNRGEWIKFVSLFFNAEAAANAYFSSMAGSVAAQDAAADGYAAAAGGAPVVAFVAYDPWSANWQMSNATYKQQYLADAGAVMAAMPVPVNGSIHYNDWTTPSTTAVFATSAALRGALAGVTVLIDETVVYPGSPETYTFATFLSSYGFTASDATSGAYPFLTRNAIFREDKTINDGQYGSFGTDWFANSISQPQAVLTDFLAVLYPAADVASRHATTWLRNLAAAEPFIVRESAQCADASIKPVCGGPSATITLPNLSPAAYSKAALQAALLAALPATATASVVVTDFPITATLRMNGPAGLLDAAGGAPGFLGALGAVLGYPVSALAAPVGTTASAVAAPSGHRRRSLFAAPAAPVSLLIMIDSFGMAGAPAAAAMLARLSNGTSLLAAVRAAGVPSATSAAADGLTVSAVVSVTVQGPGADAGLAALQAAAASGALDAALITAGLAHPPSPPSSAAAAATSLATSCVAMALAAALLLA